jgi:hypothetical protein
MVAGAQEERAGESKSVYHIVRVCQCKYKWFVCWRIANDGSIPAKVKEYKSRIGKLEG